MPVINSHCKIGADKAASVAAVGCGFGKTTDLDETQKQLNIGLLDLLAKNVSANIELSLAEQTLPTLPLMRPLEMQLSKQQRDAQLLEMFKRLTAVKMHVEALTLLPDGINRMELQQSQIRPIFTVECQLSNELIRTIPHHDMFHIMQFESEKFNSSSQCSRFGQESIRNVQLCSQPNAGIGNPKWNKQCADNNTNAVNAELNVGYIRFTVWWREPGTCLNELLGMAKLELGKHFNDSVLEQCKCLVITRRGMQLANLYCKITLQLAEESKPQFNNTLADVKQPLAILINDNNNNFDIEIKSSVVSPNDGGDKKGGKKSNHTGAGNKKYNAGVGAASSYNGKANKDDEAAKSGNSNTANSGSNKNCNGGIPPTPTIAKELKSIDESHVLKGFIYAHETYKFYVSENFKCFLICRRFWEDNAVVFRTHEHEGFKYKEIFKIVRDEPFFKRVERQQFTLEVWRRKSADGNGNVSSKESGMRMIGSVDLPLHQFYIAFKGDAMAKRLAQDACPVVSIDEWVPIKNVKTGVHIGFLKCAMAIGTETQIDNFVRKLWTRTNQKQTAADKTSPVAISAKSCFNAMSNRNLKSKDAVGLNEGFAAKTSLVTAGATAMFDQNMQSTNNVPVPVSVPATEYNFASMKSLTEKFQNALLLPPSNELTVGTSTSKCKPSFNLNIHIQRAIYSFSLNPTIKDKKGFKRSAMSAVAKKYLANEPPTTYVTFQANEGYGVMLASEDGLVYATNVAIQTTQPNWQSQFRVTVDADYLLNPQKLFILKIWQKTNMKCLNEGYQRNTILPTPDVDAAIGFVALNLSYLLQNKPIHGWYNIVDYNGRKNGALELRCVATEDINSTHAQCNQQSNMNFLSTSIACNALKRKKSDVESAMPSVKATNSAMATAMATAQQSYQNGFGMSACSFDSSLTFEKAFQSQLGEMEEINRRLRERLSFVTGAQLPNESFVNSLPLNNWQPFDQYASYDAADAESEQFWNDINVAADETEEDTAVAYDAIAAAASTDDAEVINHMISLSLNDECHQANLKQLPKE